MIPFIDLRQEPGFADAVNHRWQRALRDNAFVSGPANSELRDKLLDFTGASHFVPCANGTDAMQLALRAAGVGPGSVVLLPDLTFWATYEAVVNVGARPVMVDIDPDHLHMDFRLALQAIDEYRPQALLLVHLYGWCAPYVQELRKICSDRGIALIEDGAQAMGVRVDGTDVLGRAQIATTSFYPAKVLGAAGDGGGIFTKDGDMARRCEKLANHGRSSHYGHEYVGWNSRLDELQAHYLCEALERLPERMYSRRTTEARYLAELTSGPRRELPLTVVAPPTNVTTNGYLQVSLSRTSQAELAGHLKKLAIATGNVYPAPVSSQPGANRPVELLAPERVAYDVCPRITNLPLYPYMTESEFNAVLEAVVQVGVPESGILQPLDSIGLGQVG